MTAREIEIMSPAGSFESLVAAVQGGADSVYFGVGKLNMRSRSSQNFTIDDLHQIARICRKHGLRSYITLNTVVYDEEFDEIRTIIEAARANGIGAIIASDPAVIQFARSMDMEVHMSTQTNITNIESVKFWARYADVMVPARELTLEQIAGITRRIREEQIKGPSGQLVKIELFVHGALCMAISGKCYLSLHNYNSSANRGQCYQVCRRGYKVIDIDGDFELEIDNEYIMSPKDLKTIHFIDKIIRSGVQIFKIEGRGRPADYVKTVTRCYREAVDAYFSGNYTPENIEKWTHQLQTVYNRGFWDGYYLGQRLGEWAHQYGSMATRRKIYIGKVVNYYHRPKVAEVKIETQPLYKGDAIQITGPTTGVYEGVINEIRVNEQPAEVASQGETCTFTTTRLVRRMDKVYRVIVVDPEKDPAQ